ncbi:MAG TPA: haloacid dehalogenase-like hydrolase [Gemmatimonadaceae bacterium]|nr:haloacid dehalogenase-like hydrolase [Gemmatimonadaceae bacterium]
MQHLVLFDIDGTILHSGGAGRDAMEYALATVFGTAGDSSMRYDGKTDKQIVRESMRAAGISDTEIDAHMEQVVSLYVATLPGRLGDPERHVGLYPGVAELIAAVHARDDSVLGLLTGNVESGARLKLAAVGLDFEQFRINAFGSDNEVRGELPAIAHRRMQDAFGVTLGGRDVVVIGDTPADISCGRALGARAIAVATGSYSVDELKAHHPYAVFQDLSDTDVVMAAITG